MKGRTSLCAMMLIVAAAALTSCGEGGTASTGESDIESREQPGLTLWVNRPDAFYETTAKEVAAEMNLTLHVERTSEDLYATKIKTAVVANELPDIFMQNAGITERSLLLNSKSAAPLNDALQKLGAESKYYKGQLVKDANGQIYSVPYRSDTGYALFYNKKLVSGLGKQSPKTYEDLLDISAAAKAKGLLPIALGNKDRWPGDLLYNMLVLRQDTQAFDKARKGEMKFTDKPFVEAAKQIIELIDTGAFGYGVLRDGDQETMNMFYNGKAVFYPTGSWVFFSGAIEHLKDDLGFAIFPQTGPVDDPYTSSLSNHNDKAPYGLFVNRSSKHPDPAKEFAVRYSLKLNDVQVKSGQIPFAETEVKPEGPVHSAFAEFVEYTLKLKGTQTFWYDSLPGRTGEEYRDLTQKLYTGDMTAEAFAAQLEAVMRNGGRQ